MMVRRLFLVKQLVDITRFSGHHLVEEHTAHSGVDDGAVAFVVVPSAP